MINEQFRKIQANFYANQAVYLMKIREVCKDRVQKTQLEELIHINSERFLACTNPISLSKLLTTL